MDKLTETEIDIRIAGTRLYDYIYDLFLVHEREGVNNYNHRVTSRIKFGEAVVDLVRAIKVNLEQNESNK